MANKWAVASAVFIVLGIIAGIAYYVHTKDNTTATDDDILGDNGKTRAEYIGVQRGVQYINIKKTITDDKPFIATIMGIELYGEDGNIIHAPHVTLTITGFHADGRNTFRQQVNFDSGTSGPAPIMIGTEVMQEVSVIDMEYDMGTTYSVSRVMMRVANSPSLVGCKYTISGPDDPHIFSGTLGSGPDYTLFEAARREGFCGACLKPY